MSVTGFYTEPTISVLTFADLNVYSIFTEEPSLGPVVSIKFVDYFSSSQKIAGDDNTMLVRQCAS